MNRILRAWIITTVLLAATLRSHSQTYQLSVMLTVGHDDLRDGTEVKLTLHFVGGGVASIEANQDPKTKKFWGAQSYGQVGTAIPWPGVQEVSSIDAKLVQHGGISPDNVDINKILIQYWVTTIQANGVPLTSSAAFYCFFPHFTGEDNGNQVPGRLKAGQGIDTGTFIRGNCNID